MWGELFALSSVSSQRVLVLQPAFIGDAILATSLVETLSSAGYVVDMVVRNGNQGLFDGHPKLRNVIVWQKRPRKYYNWYKILKLIRAERYDLIVNVHRHASTGLWVALSGAREKYGFRQNPLWWACDYVAEHGIGDGTHEIERNHRLLAPLKLTGPLPPKLYPRAVDHARAEQVAQPFVTIAPASVWFTKRYPPDKWAELIRRIPPQTAVHLLGGRDDAELCERIAANSGRACVVQAGHLDLLGSAALMQRAAMNYVNDSSPLHIASAMNAPVTAFFLSTALSLGFGPLSDRSEVRRTPEPLPCRPCGLTGKRKCPKGHFECSQIEPLP